MDELQAAQEQLLRRRAEAKVQRVNMLESVKSCLSNGDLSGAVQAAEGLRDTSMWSDVVQAVMDNHGADKCPDCGEERKVYVNEKTLSVDVHCSVCAERYRINRQEAEKKNAKKGVEANIVSILKSRGVPKRFLGADPQSYPASFSKLVGQDKGFYFCGGCGVGKTHLTVAIMKAEILSLEPEQEHGRWIMPKHRMPLFVSVPDLLLEIRSTFSGDGSEREIIDRYSSTERLIMDDLGAEKSSDWVLQTLYTIIDRRNREMLWTTITSNLCVSDLSRKLDDRIASRIMEMCRIQELEGRDRRIA